MADITIRDNFLFFWRGWPGQWFRSEFRDEAGNVYHHAEKYMMAEKARFFGDAATCKRVMEAEKPSAQKALGREIQPYDEMKWRSVREKVVYQGNVLKFTQNPHLEQSLLDTGGLWIVEASPVDRIWGIGLAADDPRATSPAEWTGLNLLGIALMRVRRHLRTGRDERDATSELHD